MNHDETHEHDSLSPADAAAIDALMGATGGDPDRIAKARELMSLLSRGESDVNRDSRIDAVIASVLRASRLKPAVPTELHPQDEEALEALVGESFDAREVPNALGARARRIDALLNTLMTPVSAESDRASRIDAVMAKVSVAKTIKFPQPQAAETRRFSGRLADMVSIAAVLVLGFSLLWPVFSTARNYARQGRCTANLGNVAQALDAYESDHRGALPRATASFGGRWWDVGEIKRSNSANLVVLPRAGYTSIDNLACPGNPGACAESRVVEVGDWRKLDEVSYSYRLLQASSAASLKDPMSVVMADASPVIRRARAGQPIFPLENSANHDGTAQIALRLDGSAIRLATPVYRDDNIWLPAFLEAALKQVADQMRSGRARGTIEIRGDELPTDGDIMLAP